MYKDVAEFTDSCEKCQIYSGGRHWDELYPTFSRITNLKWMLDIVAMPTGIGQKKYLVLAWEDLTNQVEGRALQRKTCSIVCQFLLEEVFCRYGCVGQVIADRGELRFDKTKEFFTKHGVRLTLTSNEDIVQSLKQLQKHPMKGWRIDRGCFRMHYGGSHNA